MPYSIHEFEIKFITVLRSVAFVGLFNVLSARADVVLKMAKTSKLKKVEEWETKLDCKLVLVTPL